MGLVPKGQVPKNNICNNPTYVWTSYIVWEVWDGNDVNDEFFLWTGNVKLTKKCHFYSKY